MRRLVLVVALTAMLAAPAAACGVPGSNRPLTAPPGASIDGHLPKAHVPAADLNRVRALRAEIAKLVAAAREKDAWKVEEEAMLILGYKKLWLHCGSGTFAWLKLSRPPLTH